MSEKLYQINQPITVTYQAAGSAPSLTVQCDLYDEAGVLDTVQSGTMVESAVIPGVYSKSFTPDAEGGWLVRVSDSGGGKAVKLYSVGPANLKTVYAAIVDLASDVAGIATQITNVQGDVEALQSPPMFG